MWPDPDKEEECQHRKGVPEALRRSRGGDAAMGGKRMWSSLVRRRKPGPDVERRLHTQTRRPSSHRHTLEGDIPRIGVVDVDDGKASRRQRLSAKRRRCSACLFQVR